MSALWRQAGAVLLVARRELGALFHAPIAYVVAILFLILQGLSFWAVVAALADPARPAPLGAVLRSHFGGTFLHWAMLALVVSVIAMRSVAEERRQGTWETLITAPVHEGAILTGKWLGGVAFYTLLWLPTLVYPALLWLHAASGIDVGPIIAAYAAVLLCGVALIALGVAVSAATSNQIIAAVATFVVAMLLVVAGELVELAPGALARWPALAQALAHIDIRGHTDSMARGLVAAPALLFFASLALLGLVAGTTAAVWGRRRRAELRGRLAALALMIVILGCLNILGARHARAWDVSAARMNSLDARTERVLDLAGERQASDGVAVEIVAVRAGLDAFAGLQAEIDRLLARMAARQPAVRITRVDPALQPGRVAALAAELAMAVENLRDGGVVVLQRGERRRAVDLLDMAGFEPDDLGVGALVRWRAEEALATALGELLDPDRPTFCHSVAHGEARLDPQQPASGAGLIPDWTGLGRRIVRDAGRLVAVDALGAGVPAACRVLIVAGPTRALPADAAVAVADFLARGGRALITLSEELGHARAGFADSGLGLVLAAYGVAAPRAAVVDPAMAVDGPGQWLTTSYGDHPITSSFHDRRATLWLHPRALQLVAPGSGPEEVQASVLVRSSERGWGESDLTALLAGRARHDAADLDGPVAVAVAVSVPATGARLVVVGGTHALSTTLAEDHGSAGELLAATALTWLSGQQRVIDAGARTPEQVRLIMTHGQLRRTLVVCVGVLPALVALAGALVAWRRRRA